MDLINKNINWYERDNNITYLNIRNKKGEETQVLIDAEDMERTKEVKWSMYWDEDIQNYYIRSTKYLGIINGKVRYETIDNRKENLRATTNNKNVKNRKSKNRNNKSGHRNVSWISTEGVWRVQLSINGKNTKLGDFADIHEAGEFAERMRQKYYGEFAGEN